MTEEKNAPAKTQAVEDADTQPQKAGENYFAGFDFDGLKIDTNLMFKNGVYFGHQKARKNPKMGKYIYANKNGINIIDLQKTSEKLREAMEFIKQTVASGKQVLFVGTKKQAKKMVKQAAERCEMPFICERWLGGTFTNFEVISKRVKFLRDGQEKMDRGEYEKYTKFERMKIQEELDGLEQRMGGIKKMYSLPGAIFVASALEDNLGIKEARDKGIPVIALVDTNADPDVIDFPIPANDDAVSSVRLMLAYAVKAVLDGQKNINNSKVEEVK